MFLFFHKRIIPEEPGYIIDPADRRDYRREEICGASTPIEWQDLKTPESLFPIKSQDASSSCVGQSLSLAGEVLEYYEHKVIRNFSARFFYAQRSNRPDRGMMLREALLIAVKQGFALEYYLPSQNLPEDKMNISADIISDVKEAALVYKPQAFTTSNADFDSFAAILEEKKPLIIAVAGTNEGWATGVPRPPKRGERVWYHALCVPPENKNGKNYGLYNGKKAIVFNNSWTERWGIKGQGILTEDYLPYIYRHFTIEDLPDIWREDEPKQKPRHFFLRDLWYGMVGDLEVAWLQKCLKFLEFFPTNVPETGNFYSITLKAVEEFQDHYGVAHAGVPGYGRVGPKTRAKLNDIFYK